tara:strand:- start:717 stop:1358 length:642 start_codon:yes stop_codon:yes gene_type:complete
MPRKSKPRKVKNIIQQVIVNVSDVKKKSTRKRRARKSAPKEDVDIMQRVSPSIVYVQAPSVNLPSPFNPPKPTPFLEEPVKLVAPTKTDTLAVLGDVVTQSEFTPTANFVSEKEKVKSQSTIIKPITIEKAFEEPPVFGNSRFGNPNNETLTVSDTVTERLYQPKISSTKTKSFKSMKKKELQELYRTKMGSDPDAKLTRFGLIQSIEKSYNL